jgi:hypothetical protein
MADATSEASEGAMRCFGGTTTVGPLGLESRVASVELRRRKKPLDEITALDMVDVVPGFPATRGMSEGTKK